MAVNAKYHFLVAVCHANAMKKKGNIFTAINPRGQKMTSSVYSVILLSVLEQVTKCAAAAAGCTFSLEVLNVAEVWPLESPGFRRNKHAENRQDV